MESTSTPSSTEAELRAVTIMNAMMQDLDRVGRDHPKALQPQQIYTHTKKMVGTPAEQTRRRRKQQQLASCGPIQITSQNDSQNDSQNGFEWVAALEQLDPSYQSAVALCTRVHGALVESCAEIPRGATRDVIVRHIRQWAEGMTAPVGVVVSDGGPSRKLLWVNNQFSEIAGYSPDWCIGKNCKFLQGDFTDKDTVSQMTATFSSGRGGAFMVLNNHKNGEPFHNLLFCSPVESEPGLGPEVFVAVQMKLLPSKAKVRESLFHNVYIL